MGYTTPDGTYVDRDLTPGAARKYGYSKIGDYVGPTLPIVGQNFTIPNSNAAKTAKTNKVGDWFKNMKSKTSWNKGSGLNIGGKNIGKWSNIASGAIQGYNALSGLGDLGGLQEDTDTLENDILRSAMSNPLVYSYLTSDQEALLNSIRNGTYSEDADGGDFFDGLFSGLGDAVLPTVLGAATGGIPGALIGGIGSLVNSGIGGMQQGQQEANAQLAGLYSALNQAEQQYRAMRRPNTTGLGLRQSALDQMY